MNHDQFEELIALRLYGEADSQELRKLETHLSECSRCRRLASEMSADLSQLPAPSSSMTLQNTARQRPSWLIPAAAAVLGFLLGTTMPFAVGSETESRVASDERIGSVMSTAEGRPPAVTSEGGLSRLGSYLRR